MNLILCDFDSTVYNTNEMKKGWERELVSKDFDINIFWDCYRESMNGNNGLNYLDPESLYQILESHQEGWGNVARNVIESYSYGEHVIPGAHEALELLKTLGTVIIWSLGDEKFQRLKIDSSDLPNDGIYTSTDKIGDLDQFLAGYDYDRLIVIDDKPEVLSQIPDDSIKIRIGEPSEYMSFETVSDAANYLAMEL